MIKNFIAIEGNIGSGKTTLATMLSKDWGTQLMLEEFAENPFLPPFYKDPEKYAFPLELSFLGERFEQLKKTFAASSLFQPVVISDYYILKSLLFAKINLAEAEYNLFYKLFHIIFDTFPKPNLVVYLNSSVIDLQKNIKKRGRSYEFDIKDNYLENLHKNYMDAFKLEQNTPVLILNMANKDFVNNHELYNQIKTHIQLKHLPGIHIADF